MLFDEGARLMRHKGGRLSAQFEGTPFEISDPSPFPVPFLSSFAVVSSAVRKSDASLPVFAFMLALASAFAPALRCALVLPCALASASVSCMDSNSSVLTPLGSSLSPPHTTLPTLLPGSTGLGV